MILVKNFQNIDTIVFQTSFDSDSCFEFYLTDTLFIKIYLN